MGQGIDLARLKNPEHAKAIDDLKDQLLIVFLRRLGGTITLPIIEIDDTGGWLFALKVDPIHLTFTFTTQKGGEFAPGSVIAAAGPQSGRS
jgi:hypothetical protein